MTSASLTTQHSTAADVRPRLIQRTLWDAHFSVLQVGLDFPSLSIHQNLHVYLDYPQYFPPGVLPSVGGAAFEIALCNNTNFNWYCCNYDGNGTCCNDPDNDLSIVQATVAYRASSPSQTEASSSSSTAVLSKTSTDASSAPTPTGPSSAVVPSPIGPAQIHLARRQILIQ